ncbi:unnamed protein product [Vicia faba]|uniref:WRKY domain-containing protein n=1 Tax=Vicia faba TaxID=3906 RepID=A0AAV1AZG0_VICFA|nr:unnamed protein product [Vicia faba]
MENSTKIKRPKSLIKKRKSMPRWKEQVKICTNTGLFKGSLDDDYSWRKYGQKDILGTKFPRAYYRCKHRNGQGCLATKQIQRSDEDPTTIEVTYRGRHTCSQPKISKKNFPSKLENKKLHNDQKNQPQTQGANFSLKDELEETKEENFHWFCFPSLSIGSENETIMESFSDALISPETSKSNFYGLSEYHFGYNAQTSESDMNETLSATTSDTNSPIHDLDILLDRGDFDTDFPFNTPE